MSRRMMVPTRVAAQLTPLIKQVSAEEAQRHPFHMIIRGTKGWYAPKDPSDPKWKHHLGYLNQLGVDKGYGDSFFAEAREKVQEGVDPMDLIDTLLESFLEE